MSSPIDKSFLPSSQEHHQHDGNGSSQDDAQTTSVQSSDPSSSGPDDETANGIATALNDDKTIPDGHLPLASASVAVTGPDQVSCQRLALLTTQALDNTDPSSLPLMGPGLPFDHVGHINQGDAVQAAVRQSSENTRLTLQRTAMNDGVHFAPVRGPRKRILDLGAGSGAWAMLAKAESPKSTVIAVHDYMAVIKNDKADIQHGSGVIFQHFPIRERPLSVTPVDLIRVGHVIAHVQDLPFLLLNCNENLKLGGYLEIQAFEPLVLNDADDCPATECPLNFLFQLLCRNAADREDLFDWAELVTPMLQKTGFDKVDENRITCPIGKGARTHPTFRAAGAFTRKILSDYVDSIDRDLLIKHRGFSAQDADLLFEQVYAVLDDPQSSVSLQLVCFTAKKTRDPDEAAVEED